MKEKHPCHTKLCAFRCLISKPQILNLRSQNQIRGKLLFLENYVTSEVAISQNVLYYQPIPIICYQVRFLLIIILSNYQLCPLPLSLDSRKWIVINIKSGISSSLAQGSRIIRSEKTPL